MPGPGPRPEQIPPEFFLTGAMDDERLKTVLDLASAGETTKLGEYLAEHQISPSIRDGNGWSPLILASKVSANEQRISIDC